MNAVLAALREEREGRHRAVAATSASANKVVVELLDSSDEDEAPPPKRARVASPSQDEAFHSLAQLVIYQKHDRRAAEAADSRLCQALGGVITQSALLGVAGGGTGLARLMGQARWVEKGQAMINLASVWSSLQVCPSVRRGIKDDADREFERVVKARVKGVGPWTIGQFFIGIGRTDVLMAECYEVKTGLKHLLASQGAAQAAVGKAAAAATRQREAGRAADAGRGAGGDGAPAVRA